VNERPGGNARRIVVAIVGATAVLGCRVAPPAPTQVTIAYPSGLTAAEPNRDIEEFSLSILGNLFEGLVDIDAELALRPALAESWSSPDDLTWVFRLRPGVVFHDGSKLEAADVVRSLERLRKDTEHELAPALAEVAEITADDPLTVRLRTRFPVPSLPYHLASLFISRLGDVPGRPLGTGPYRLAEWTPQTGDAEIVAFPGYWGGAPRVETVRFRALPEAEARVRALENGEADLAVDVPAADFERLTRSAALRTEAARGLRVVFLGLVAPGDHPQPVAAFADARVRRAIALAIDRERLVREPLGGHGEVIDQILAPEVFGYASDLPRLPYDPAESRRLLANAGFGGGFDVALDFPSGRYRSIDAVARAVASDLAAIGVRVIERPAPSAAFFERMDARRSDFFLMGWMSSGDAPLSYDYLLHRREAGQGVDNYSNYADAEFDRLLEQTELEPSAAQRGARIHALAERVLRDLPLVPLYRQFDLYAMRAGLDFRPRPDRRIRGVELGWRAPEKAETGAR
jgi:peptide/nickel transport system substrate-binding protein